MIKIEFSFETKYGAYRDALHLPEDHKLSADEIEALKKERLDKWIHIVENPPVQESPAIKIFVDGETYSILEGVPPPGAKLIEQDGTWYYKV